MATINITIRYSSCNCNLRLANSQDRSHLLIWGQRQWKVLWKSEKHFLRCGAAANVLGKHAHHLVRKHEVRHDAMIAIILLPLLIIWLHYLYTLSMSSSIAAPAHIASTTPRLVLNEYRWLCALWRSCVPELKAQTHKQGLAHNLSFWGMTTSCETCELDRFGCRKSIVDSGSLFVILGLMCDWLTCD
jgi:hypothetical protein